VPNRIITLIAPANAEPGGELSSIGENQCTDRKIDLGAHPFDTIICSTAKSAVETAKFLSGQDGKSFVPVPALARATSSPDVVWGLITRHLNESPGCEILVVAEPSLVHPIANVATNGRVAQHSRDTAIPECGGYRMALSGDRIVSMESLQPLPQ